MSTEADLEKARQRIAAALDRLETALERRGGAGTRAIETENTVLRERYDALEAHARAALAELDRLLDIHGKR